MTVMHQRMYAMISLSESVTEVLRVGSCIRRMQTYQAAIGRLAVIRLAMLHVETYASNSATLESACGALAANLSTLAVSVTRAQRARYLERIAVVASRKV